MGVVNEPYGLRFSSPACTALVEKWSLIVHLLYQRIKQKASSAVF
jgi:hypothetical protein